MLSGTGGKKREFYGALSRPGSSGTLSHPEYHDYSNETALEDSTGITKPDAASFPARLYEMLEQSEQTGHSDIIRWMPHGRAFKVFDRVRFETDVLPCYFISQTKYGSFHRQLNMYGYRRMTTHGNDQGAYYHERFLRGRPILSSLVSRCRTFGSSVRQKCDPTTEPDFAKIPPVETHVTVSDRRMDPVVAESSMHPSTLEIEQCLTSETGLANKKLLVHGAPYRLHEARSPTGTKLHKIVQQRENIGQGFTEPVPLSTSYAAWYDSLYDNPINFGDKRSPTLFDPGMVNDVIAIFGTQTSDQERKVHVSQES